MWTLLRTQRNSYIIFYADLYFYDQSKEIGAEIWLSSYIVSILRAFASSNFP